MRSLFISKITALGRRLFPFRLFVGLAVVLISAEWLIPVPFFGEHYRWLHLFAVLLVAGGLALRGWGAGSAGGHTRTHRIEAPQLATGGAYAYVRNPIYAGTIALGLGMSLLVGDPRAILCAVVALTILYVSIVPAEEAFLLQQFGGEYQRYQAAVPRLIPRLRPWTGRNERPFQWRAVRGELGILMWLGIIYGGLLFEEYLDQLGIS